MYVLMTILIIIVCVLLMGIVLIQNPKGGGLTASLGSIGNQMMGARKTTDFLERTTWTLAIVLLVFSLLGSYFVPREEMGETRKSEVEGIINEGMPPMQSQPTEPLTIPEEE